MKSVTRQNACLRYPGKYEGCEITFQAMRRLQADIAAIDAMPFWRKVRIRQRLLAYKTELSGRKANIVNSVLHHVKSMCQDDRDLHRKSHVLSDHAFVRVLERGLDLDISELKNKALDTISERGLVPIYSEDRLTIMTVYPREWGKVQE